MKTSSGSNRKVQLAFGSAIFALLLVGAVSYRGMAVSDSSERWVRQSHQVLETLQDLRFAMESLQSNCRGFELTGNESFLRAYQLRSLRITQDQTMLRTLTADNPEQQRRLSILDSLARQEIERTQIAMDRRRSQGLEAAAEALRSVPGQPIVGDFQTVIGEAQDEETGLLALRDADARRRVSQTKTYLTLGIFLGLLMAAVAYLSMQRKNSARSLAEKAFRESEERYRMLLDGVQDHAIFMLDPRGQIMSWNAGAERVQGYAPEEIIGRNFSCLFPAEDIQHGRPEAVLAIAATSGRYEEQSMRVRKNGTRFLANVTFTALREPGGSLRGFSEVSRDLSESKESGAKYRGLLEAAPDAMVVVNPAGEIVLLNVQAEKQFGYRRDELVGQQVKNIIPEGFAERLIADGTRSAAEALAQQIGTGIELLGRRKRQQRIPDRDHAQSTRKRRGYADHRRHPGHQRPQECRSSSGADGGPLSRIARSRSRRHGCGQPAGEIVLLNVQAEKQFGYRRDELVGQQVKNIIPEGFAERLIADGTRSAAEAPAQQIGTGIELTGRRKDGSEFPHRDHAQPT